MTLIAHLSDTHFDGHQRSESRGRLVMDYLNRLPRPPDAIVHTGDITDHGLPAEIEQAAKVLGSDVPVYTCPGNHDGYTPYPGPRNTVAQIGPARLILCDSVIQGRDDGELADQTIEWLQETLAGTPEATPVLIGFHHPPVRLHHGMIDEIRLGKADRLEALVTRYPQIVAILCGHAHTAAASTFGGRPVLVAPGVTSTLLMPWEVAGEATFANSIDHAAPPGLAFHVLDDQHRLTTHFRHLPD